MINLSLLAKEQSFYRGFLAFPRFDHVYDNVVSRWETLGVA